MYETAPNSKLSLKSLYQFSGEGAECVYVCVCVCGGGGVTVVTVFVVAPYFFRLGGSKNGMVTAGIGRTLSQYTTLAVVPSMQNRPHSWVICGKWVRIGLSSVKF